MDQRFDPPPAADDPCPDPRLGAHDVWSLLTGAETRRVDGVEWLLDWIERDAEDRR